MNDFSTKSTSCCVDGIGSRKITREEVATLRNIPIGKKSWLRKLRGAFENMMHDVKLLSAPKNNSMCKFYGHVIESPWKGYNPHCRDCGCEIKSPDQLRKAHPRR